MEGVKGCERRKRRKGKSKREDDRVGDMRKGRGEGRRGEGGCCNGVRRREESKGIRGGKQDG